MDAAAIITAAGAGTRLGANQPKALVALAGRPLVSYAAAAFVLAGIHDIVVTAPPTHLADMRAALCSRVLTQAAHLAWPHETSRRSFASANIQVVAGGASRQASVGLGIQALREQPPAVVLVHDAARCLTPPALIAQLVQRSANAAAVIPALPVADTLKQVAAPPIQSEASAVTGSVDRSGVIAVQTPQACNFALLAKAHDELAHLSADERHAATDDASLLQALGEPVLAIAGSEMAFKITTPLDLQLAHALVSGERANKGPHQ